MASSALENLLSIYPEIIKSMPLRFDSHEFILRLAQDHQRLYVQALQEYAESERPFQILHGLLAKMLNNFPVMVAKIGEQNTKDIFRQVNSATVWQKVNK